MISASQLRAGMAVRYQGQTYRVLAADYHPGQGKMPGSTHTRLQNVATGTFWEHSLRPELKLEDLPVEKHPLEYLYADGDQHWFMNPETYEQVEIPNAAIGQHAAFLAPGMRFAVEFVEDQPVNVQFPDMLEVRIADTAPAAHQQQDSTLKPARLENGVEIMVPQFVRTDDLIRLDLQTLKYVDLVREKSARAATRP
ncbi:MAG TPA: hypothetical protein VFA04_18075 [Bryobacteraceae bacterium]|nr:hypothetical protein [Bryobacteraceae bacterium]